VEPAKIVEELSAQKAEAVFESLAEKSDYMVIGSDTVVASEGKILGKPKTQEEAKEMLRALSGKVHEVFTGVTILVRKEGKTYRNTFHERTGVEFCEMTEAEINCYVASGDCMDKAGAYGIQGFCARYIRGIEGDYNNVVGLPAGRVYQEIKGMGIAL
jgi:septum formation protein